MRDMREGRKIQRAIRTVLFFDRHGMQHAGKNELRRFK